MHEADGPEPREQLWTVGGFVDVAVALRWRQRMASVAADAASGFSVIAGLALALGGWRWRRRR